MSRGLQQYNVDLAPVWRNWGAIVALTRARPELSEIDFQQHPGLSEALHGVANRLDCDQPALAQLNGPRQGYSGPGCTLVLLDGEGPWVEDRRRPPSLVQRLLSERAYALPPAVDYRIEPGGGQQFALILICSHLDQHKTVS